jgi:hypothetical protein
LDTGTHQAIWEMKMKHRPSVILEACLEEARIDTHAHLTESYLTLEEKVEQLQSFGTTEALISSRVAAEGCRRL